MKIRLVLVSLLRVILLVGVAALLIPAKGRAADTEKSVAIICNDTLRFSVTKITASPGQALHVQLKNQGTLPKAVGGTTGSSSTSTSRRVPMSWPP